MTRSTRQALDVVYDRDSSGRHGRGTGQNEDPVKCTLRLSHPFVDVSTIFDT